MASVQTLHEILVRFDPETGAFQGAHAIDSKRTVDDDDGDVHVKLLDARPITKADVGKILGAKNADLIDDATQARQVADDALVAQRNAETHAQEMEGRARDALERAERAEAQLAKVNGAITAARGIAEKMKAAQEAKSGEGSA